MFYNRVLNFQGVKGKQKTKDAQTERTLKETKEIFIGIKENKPFAT